MMIRLRPLCCLFLLLAGCTTGKPGTTNRPYTVYAENPAGFSRSVRARGPRGGRAFGLVEITFHPDYDLVPETKGCTTKTRSVGLELVIVLPKWREGKPVPQSVKRRWMRFRRTVTAHEDSHIRIAKNYAEKMRRSIASLRSGKSCGDLSNRIRTRITELKRQHISAHQRFDNREKMRLKTLL
ncbi:putative secreted Zn-dependent protease [Hoeflea sp. IMCC20628]|uniref:DUF922 domain-containing protein n=1 Tax=Hoeflea sp. IMCC20628 TaxID=1620421 RepID=UPI00063AB66A|nr:DUF922 domain-containing protein [Hoeflea sp. IMCC20628]AKI01147.1 putative secreted Zn-dependent protease [Hoeflea sp. IMCC20628]